MPRPAHPPTSHFRSEKREWDTRSSYSSAIMDGENTTMRLSDLYLRPEVLHMSQALHSLIIRMVLLNQWSLQSLKKLGQWWLTPRLPFSSGKKQLIPQSFSIEDHRIKAWKERRTTMAIKNHMKHHTRCYIELPNLCTMLKATRYRVKIHFTTYVDSEVTPADWSPRYNAKSNSVEGQCPAWW